MKFFLDNLTVLSYTIFFNDSSNLNTKGNMNEEMVARLIDEYRPEAYATAMAARDAYASIDAAMIEFCDEVIERHGLEEADAVEVTKAFVDEYSNL